MDPILIAFLTRARNQEFKVFTTPISSSGRESQRDYFREMECILQNEGHQWNGESNKKIRRYKNLSKHLPQAGWPFVYIHEDKQDINGGVAEFYQIKEVLPSSAKRPWWSENRYVLKLSTNKIGECSVRELCDRVIKFNFKSGVEFGKQGTRFAGNRIYNWNESFDLEESIEESIMEEVIPEETVRSAIAWIQPPSSITQKICSSIAERINAVAGKNLTHENGWRAAAKTFEMVASVESGNRGISIGDLQSGKTQKMIVLSHAFPELISQSRNIPIDQIKVGVILVSNKSQRTLRDQTISRFIESGFDKQMPDNGDRSLWLRSKVSKGFCVVVDVMLSGGAFDRLISASNLFKQNGITHTLILLDEVHNATQDGQQFATFLKEQGWAVQNEKSNVYQPPLFIIGVTATALQKFVLPDVEGHVELYYSYNPPGEGYYGVSEMLEQGRLQDIDADIWKFDDYRDSIESNPLLRDDNDKKYIVVRLPVSSKVTKSDKERNIRVVFEELGKLYDWAEPREFTSSANAIPIENLDPQLSTEPSKHQVLFIKNASGAGDTFNTLQHIGAIYDLRYKDPESQIQAGTGRSCGYTRDRRQARYPIFLNLDNLLLYHDTMKLCVNGTPVEDLRSAYSGGRSNAKLHIENGPYIKPEHLKFGTREEFERDTRNAQHLSQLTRSHVSDTTTHLNKVVNVSAILLGNIKEQPRNQAAFFDCSKPPVNEDFLSDYNHLIATYPQLSRDNIGCWVDRKYLRFVQSNKHSSKSSVINRKIRKTKPNKVENPLHLNENLLNF